MNESNEVLKVFEEELGELAIELLKLQQLVSKAIRFGLEDSWEEHPKNIVRIQSEWNDVLGAVEVLNKAGIDLAPNKEAITKKVEKIKYFTEEYNNQKKIVLKVSNFAHDWTNRDYFIGVNDKNLYCLIDKRDFYLCSKSGEPEYSVPKDVLIQYIRL